MTPLEKLLERLPAAKKSDNGWSACCPAHDDRRASLSIAQGDDSSALLKCHAGCDTAMILEALSLKLADLFPAKPGLTPTRNGKHAVSGRTFTTAQDAVAELERQQVPSEAFSLTWNDVNWERGRLSVPSPKTEHLGKPQRVIPLFPLLRPHLEATFEQALEGSVYIFPDDWRARATGNDGWAGANMRTTFAKIVRRAGVEPWPRLWHSLRASCESDLAQSFPLATVTKWLGNTPSVALRHYVDPTEMAFDRALEWWPEKSGAKSGALVAQKAAQRADAKSGDEAQNLSEVLSDCESTPLVSCRNSLSQENLRECMGIEPTESFVQTLSRF